MITIDLNVISHDLPGYLQRLHAGETVLIVQDNHPVAELKLISEPSSEKALRPFGLCASEFAVPDDFDAPLPDPTLADFEGV